MRKIAFSILCLAAGCIDLAAQSGPPLCEWATSADSDSGSMVWRIRNLGNNRLAICGWSGTYIKLGDTNLAASDSNAYQIGYFADLDDAGHVIGGSAISSSQYVAVYDTDYIKGARVVTGNFSGALTLGATQLQCGPNAEAEGFIAMVDGEGNNLWAVQSVTSVDEMSQFGRFNLRSATFTSNDRVIVGGDFSGAGALLGSVQVTNVAPFFDYTDLVLVCLSNAGQLLWARSFGGAAAEQFGGLAVADDGGFCVVGDFNSPQLQFGGNTLSNPTGTHVGFLARFDADGDPLWAKAISPSGGMSPWSVAIDDSGNVVITGFSNFTDRRIYVGKFDPNGALIWENANSTDEKSTGASIVTDNEGNIFVSGQSGGAASVWKFTPGGSLAWQKRMGGTAFAYSVAVGDDGGPEAVGSFQSAEFVVDGFTLTNSVPSVPIDTAFVAKLMPDPPELRFQQTGSDFIVSWPTNQPAFQLEANDLSFSPAGWQPVEFGATGPRFVATNQTDQTGRVFRLKKAN